MRQAVDGAFKQLDVRVTWLDNKSLLETANEVLPVEKDELMASLQSIKPEIFSPWRKEERLSAIAAWVSLSVSKEE